MKQDKYLIPAINYLKEKPEGIFSNNKVIKEMPGYISSFGATIIQSGLIPAVALYSQEGGQGKNKKPLMNALLHLVGSEGKTALLDLALEKKKQNTEAFFRKEVTRAAVSLKLALRTFEIDSK